MPKAYCDILQYMRNILRFYHNILFIIFCHYSRHYLSQKYLDFCSIYAKSKVLSYEINSSTLSTIIYALKISEGIERADE